MDADFFLLPLCVCCVCVLVVVAVGWRQEGQGLVGYAGREGVIVLCPV